jgi:two-component system, cell cycle sensor histidine kinase and response regulator CckA
MPPAQASKPPAEVVLLVDDEPAIRQLARAALKASGYRTLEARSADEAVRTSDDYPGRIDLLLTDVVMPRWSGGTLGTVLSARRPDMKVLLMSGYPDDPAVRRAILSRAVNFLPKPFTLDDLTRKVRETLDAA